MQEDGEWLGKLGQLSVMCAAMVVGAFGAGLVPLYIQLDPWRLNMMNVFAAGLMTGTSFAVILPEGLHTLYESKEKEKYAVEGHSHSSEEHSMLTNESIVGLSLVLGFLSMLLIDHCGGGSSHNHGHSHSHGVHLSRQIGSRDDLSDLGLSGPDDSEDDDIHGDDGHLLTDTSVEMISIQTKSIRDRSGSNIFDNENAPEKRKRRSIVTIGMLVHAVADGFALGAAQASSDGASWNHAGLVVFLAIMLHKMPAAFALTMFLRASRQDMHSVRTSLFLFALAAPVGAYMVFFLLQNPGWFLVPDSTIAFVLIYSAGTFLYISVVHAFQELPKDVNGNLSRTHCLTFMAGCCLPVILAAGHEH